MILSKSELKENGLSRKDNGFGFIAYYKGITYVMSGRDELDAYRLFVQLIDDEEAVLWQEVNSQ